MKFTIRTYFPEDENAVIKLWSDCNLIVPWNDPQKDIQRKSQVQPDLFWVGCFEDSIIASVMAGYDGHRGWIYYLAVDPDHQNRGIGRKMMKTAERRLFDLGCVKINLQVRTTNKEVIAFYENLGFTADDVRSFGKRLKTDD